MGEDLNAVPDPLNSYSTPTSAILSCAHGLRAHEKLTCYPERNFAGNQLLDGSIGLSPLCPGSAIDLHVRTATVFQHRFLVSLTFPDIDHHLSGLMPSARAPRSFRCLFDSLTESSPWSVFQDGYVDFHDSCRCYPACNNS